MKLLREDIGKPFVNEDVSGIFPYQFSETVEAGWIEVTGILNTHLYGGHAADYVRATKEMAVLFNEKTGATESDKWANCDAVEQSVLAERHIVSSVLRLEVVSVSEDMYNFNAHAVESISSRQNRIDKATVSIGYQIPSTVNRVDLFTDIFSLIEGFVKVNDASLHNYMHSTGSYVGNGFKEKAYWSQEVEDIYTTIVENGE